MGACPEPIIDHQHAIEKDINSLLSRIEQAKSPTVNKEPVKAFILSIQSFLRKQQSASSHAEIIIKLNRIEESTRTTAARVGQLTTNVESISSASTTSTHAKNANLRTWAHIASCNTTAPIFQSPPPSTTSAESDDCRITIKQISPTNRSSLQKATPSDIRARVNRAIKDSRCEEIAHLSVLGAKSLPSGDLHGKCRKRTDPPQPQQTMCHVPVARGNGAHPNVWCNCARD